MSTTPPPLTDPTNEKALLAAVEKFFGLEKKKFNPNGELRRCPHGMYDPHGDQRGCTVCNPVPIPGNAPTRKAKGSSGVVLVTVRDAKLPDPLEPFRGAIKKALAYTISSLYDMYGNMHLDELAQIVNIEISKAIERYGAKRMNERLAYRIAKIHAARFINELKKQSDEMPTLSLNDKRDDGEEVPETSVAEDLFNKSRQGDGTESSLSRNAPGDLDQLIGDALEGIGGVPALRKLVRSWHGVKRKIGEYLLKHPDATVRQFPGVPPSTAARVRSAVLVEFAKALRDLQPAESGTDTRNIGTKDDSTEYIQ